MVYMSILIYSFLLSVFYLHFPKTFNEKLAWQKSNAVKSSLVLHLKECVE